MTDTVAGPALDGRGRDGTANWESGPFVRDLWSAVAAIQSQILSHPFIAGLTSGRLPKESFRAYVLQDALYLREFARVLAIAAARATRDDWILMFGDHAAGVIRVERGLHEGFFREFGLTPAEVATTGMAPTTQAYTNHLLAVAYGSPFHELLAAVLPCYWIYWEVGKALEAASSPDPMYARWIGTYAAEQFGASVRAVLDVADATAAQVGLPERAAMLRRFVASARYEWMFWDMAYRVEEWPVGPTDASLPGHSRS